MHLMENCIRNNPECLDGVQPAPTVEMSRYMPSTCTMYTDIKSDTGQMVCFNWSRLFDEAETACRFVVVILVRVNFTWLRSHSVTCNVNVTLSDGS